MIDKARGSCQCDRDNCRVEPGRLFDKHVFDCQHKCATIVSIIAHVDFQSRCAPGSHNCDPNPSKGSRIASDYVLGRAICKCENTRLEFLTNCEACEMIYYWQRHVLIARVDFIAFVNLIGFTIIRN